MGDTPSALHRLGDRSRAPLTCPHRLVEATAALLVTGTHRPSVMGRPEAAGHAHGQASADPRVARREHRRRPARAAGPGAGNFDAFRREYNDERPHEALGHTTPASHYTASPRPYRSRLPVPEYPGHFLAKIITCLISCLWHVGSGNMRDRQNATPSRNMARIWNKLGFRRWFRNHLNWFGTCHDARNAAVATKL